MTEKEIEQAANDFRYHVRKKAGLDGHWYDAPESMKQFYRDLIIKTCNIRRYNGKDK